VSLEHCLSFLDPLIDSWIIDLGNFAMEIVLNPRLAPGRSKRFEFIEQNLEPAAEEEQGLKEFLADPLLSGNATNDELEFLKKLRLKGKRPTAMYYYRELQNLRDPIHFRGPAERGAARGVTARRISAGAPPSASRRRSPRPGG
jgi:hypothetical protein